MVNDAHAIFFYDSWAEAKRNERVRGSFKMLYNRFRKAIMDLLMETWKDSGLSPEDMEDLASMIMAIQDGVSLQWDMDPDNVSLKKMSRMTKQLIELYIEDRQCGKAHEKAARLRRTSKPSEAG
jgi:hypothetical protein